VAYEPIKKRLSDAETIDGVQIDQYDHISGTRNGTGSTFKITLKNLIKRIHSNVDRAYGGAGANDIVVNSGAQVLQDKTIKDGILQDCVIKTTGDGPDVLLEDIIHSEDGGGRRRTDTVCTLDIPIDDRNDPITLRDILEASDPIRVSGDDTIYIKNIISIAAYEYDGASPGTLSPLLGITVDHVVSSAPIADSQLDRLRLPEGDKEVYLTVRYYHTEVVQ